MKKLITVFLILITSGSFAQSVTESIYPRFIQGVGSGNAADDRKVPYACRMTISGLLPNATYRGYNKFVTDPLLTDNGQGNYIIVNPTTGTFTRVTSASLASAGRYLEFTTNGSGSYTGWFISEPTIATSHFQPGTQLYFRLMLNDGAGGAFVNSRATATNAVTVIGFGAGSTAGTGVRSSPTATAVAKNFVMLYDNVNGTGRPVTGTFIESDDTEESVANGYAPFYANNVDAVSNTWGTIIPNNLANGINNITQFNLANATIVNTCTSVNGVYGATNTANATGGLTELVLTTNCITSPVTLLSFTANVNGNNKAALQWNTSTEISFARFAVERSRDGRSYQEIGSRNASGDNSQYSFDDILLPGITYYRLRIIDLDGTYSYSHVIPLQSNLKDVSLLVSPNPAKDQISVWYPLAKPGAKIELFGINGQLMSSQPMPAGTTQHSINLGSFKSGQYILRYSNDGKTQTTRVQKL
jgi:hypothetical protein